jgi:hypothetical protein
MREEARDTQSRLADVLCPIGHYLLVDMQAGDKVRCTLCGKDYERSQLRAEGQSDRVGRLVSLSEGYD